MSKKEFIKVAEIKLCTSLHKENISYFCPQMNLEETLYLAYSQSSGEARFFVSDTNHILEVGWSGGGMLPDYDIKEPPRVREMVEKIVYEIK